MIKYTNYVHNVKTFLVCLKYQDLFWCFVPAQQAFNIHLKPTGSQSHWISYTPLHEVGTKFRTLRYWHLFNAVCCLMVTERERWGEGGRVNLSTCTSELHACIWQTHCYCTILSQGLGYEARTYRPFVSLSSLWLYLRNIKVDNTIRR